MFRLWGKLWKDNRLLQDMVVCNGEKDLNRTGKVYRAIEEICYAFDLSRPMWLKSNITEFQKHDKVRFGKDNFVE